MPNEALDEAERAEWIRFWRTALVRTLKRPQAFTSRSERHYPDDNERWVLQATALLVLQLRESEEPDLFWQPILDLVDEANDWSESSSGRCIVRRWKPRACRQPMCLCSGASYGTPF